MSRSVLAIVLAAALSGAAGCVYEPAGRCESRADCGAGEQCEAGVCVASAGTGGVDPTFAPVLWSSIAAQGGATFEVDSVGADLAGNVVVGGAVDAPFDFGPDTVAPGAFVLLLDPSGATSWAVSFPTFEHERFETAVLPDGDVLFAATAFDPTGIGTYAFTPPATGALIVGRLDAATRDPVWARAIDSTHLSADIVPTAVTASAAGDLLVAGVGSGDFGCLPGGDTASESFAAALGGGDGQCLWSRGFGTRTLADIEPMGTTRVAVAGVCTPAGASFDPDGSTTCTAGLFVAALSGADGWTDWLTTTSGSGTVSAVHDLAVGPDGRATVVGDAKGVVDLGLGPTDFGSAFEGSFAATWDPSGAPTALVRPVEDPYAAEPDAVAFSRCPSARGARLWIGGTYVGQPKLGGTRFSACRAPACSKAAFLAELAAGGGVASFLPLRAAPVGGTEDEAGAAYVDDVVLFATTGTVAAALRFTGEWMGGDPDWATSAAALGVVRMAP